MLEFAQVSVGSGGAIACVRCGHSGDGPEYLPAGVVVEDVERIAGAWTAGAGPNVELVGPDPLGHPELPSLVAGAMRAGVQRLRLATPAGGFSAGGNAAGAVSAGVLHVRFPLLGGSAGLHDALLDRPAALEVSLAGIRAFREAASAQTRPVHVGALVPVCRHNARDLPSAVGVAVEAGADEVVLRIVDGGLDLASAIPWVGSACATGVTNGVWVEVDGVPACLLPGDELHVADMVRSRPGTHGPRCSACPLNALCAGGPGDASADILSRLEPPQGAEGLATRMRRAREGVAP